MSSKVVLIRGLFRGKYHWGKFPEILQELLPNKKIICVDIPGSGDLSYEISPSSIEKMVESIRQQLSLKNKVDVVSISMGGMIALKWAQIYPNEVDKVVCINTSAKGFSPFYQRLLPKNYLKILIALFSTPLKRESIIYGMVSNKKMDIDIINYWVLLSKHHPVQRVNFFRQLLAALRFEVKQPDCKLLFISSIKDRLVSYKATEAMAKKWKVELIHNELDGHDIPLDNPKLLCEHLVHWL
jgi:pimeloyl-ACP methyl ester carboxylesterase